MQNSTLLKKYAAMPVQWIMTCCLVFLGSQLSYAATCTTTPASNAPNDHTVLMLATTLTDSTGNPAGDLCASLEAVQANALDLDVEIDDAAAWGAKTQAQFATYRAIVLGDADCPTETSGTVGDESVQAAVANQPTWSAAITGPVAIVGTDPVFHYITGVAAGATLTQNAIALATSVPGSPGAYICLSCYYETISGTQTVDVLQSFGTFTVAAGPSNSVSILAETNPLVTSPNPLTGEDLSNWSNSVHEVFTAFPSTFTAVAQSNDLEAPYILASNGQTVPSQTKTVDSTDETPTEFDFNGGPGDGGGYAYTAKLNDGTVSIKVTPVLKTQAECNALIRLNPAFTGAQCMVYENADGVGGSFAVMFEVTCPDRPNSECDSTDSTGSFDAELGSEFTFDLTTHNPDFDKINPQPGWLKGHGPDSVHPCSANPDGTTALFQSNQIKSFEFVGDPRATTKGTSGGTGSCWVATYNTPNVLPAVSVTTPSEGAVYTQGASIASSFLCTPVNHGTDPTGPYLTVSTSPTPGCTAIVDGVGSPMTSGFAIPTTLGPHTFVATVHDSGSDNQTQTVHYTVAASATIGISPNPVNFGTIYLDKNPRQTITVTNTGGVPVKFTKVAITPGTGPDARGFKTQNNTCSGTLNPGRTCSVVVVFNDDHAGLSTATLFFYDNASGSPQGVGLSGNAINPKISVSPSTLSFGTHKVNSTSSKTVVLKSTGTSPLNFNSITLGGTNAADFTKSGCTSSSLAPGASCTLTVTFKPKAKGSRSANITISDNASNSPQKVTLTGTGN